MCIHLHPFVRNMTLKYDMKYDIKYKKYAKYLLGTQMFRALGVFWWHSGSIRWHHAGVSMGSHLKSCSCTYLCPIIL